MTRPVTAIRNIGPATEKQFQAAGINTAEEIEDMGCDEAYAILIKHGAKPHFMAFVALWMGLEGRPFTSITPEEKVSLRERFDALKSSQAEQSSGLDAFLNEIGIGKT
jgi:hypothetical protein